MDVIREYITYLQDNPEHLWFKRKLYGWGWTPVRWQGWFIVLAFIVFLVWNGVSLDKYNPITSEQMVWFFARIVLSVFLLIVICYKTGETPRWQWGVPKK